MHRVKQNIFKTTAGTLTTLRAVITFPSWVVGSTTQLQYRREVGNVDVVCEVERVVGVELTLDFWQYGSRHQVWRLTLIDVWRVNLETLSLDKAKTWHQNVVVWSSASWINFVYKSAYRAFNYRLLRDTYKNHRVGKNVMLSKFVEINSMDFEN